MSVDLIKVDENLPKHRLNSFREKNKHVRGDSTGKNDEMYCTRGKHCVCVRALVLSWGCNLYIMIIFNSILVIAESNVYDKPNNTRLRKILDISLVDIYLVSGNARFGTDRAVLVSIARWSYVCRKYYRVTVEFVDPAPTV